jgi:hypothetical protein
VLGWFLSLQHFQNKGTNQMIYQNTYRITRKNVYGPNTPGHTDPSARQGYYQIAYSPEEAIAKARVQYKDAIRNDDVLEVSLWHDSRRHVCSYVNLCP